MDSEQEAIQVGGYNDNDRQLESGHLNFDSFLSYVGHVGCRIVINVLNEVVS